MKLISYLREWLANLPKLKIFSSPLKLIIRNVFKYYLSLYYNYLIILYYINLLLLRLLSDEFCIAMQDHCKIY